MAHASASGAPRVGLVTSPGERREVAMPRAMSRAHWPEYAIEAAGLGVFMFSACLFATLLEHPASPVRRALPDAFLRLVPMGLTMGLTAVALIDSPWGRRSGAHFNPVTPLAFWRLGTVAGWDAVFFRCGYAAAR